jgi:hypothetical protein
MVGSRGVSESVSLWEVDKVGIFVIKYSVSQPQKKEERLLAFPFGICQKHTFYMNENNISILRFGLNHKSLSSLFPSIKVRKIYENS